MANLKTPITTLAVFLVFIVAAVGNVSIAAIVAGVIITIIISILLIVAVILIRRRNKDDKKPPKGCCFNVLEAVNIANYVEQLFI